MGKLSNERGLPKFHDKKRGVKWKSKVWFYIYSQLLVAGLWTNEPLAVCQVENDIIQRVEVGVRLFSAHGGQLPQQHAHRPLEGSATLRQSTAGMAE